MSQKEGFIDKTDQFTLSDITAFVLISQLEVNDILVIHDSNKDLNMSN